MSQRIVHEMVLKELHPDY